MILLSILSGGVSAVALAMLLLAVFIVSKGLKIIKQSEAMIIERLGKYNRTLHAGLNIIIPILDAPRKIHWRELRVSRDGRKIPVLTTRDRIDLRETVYDFPKQNVITRDNVVTEINALLYFQIVDPVKAVYEIANLPNAIEKLTQTTLRNVIGEMDLDDCLSSRDVINMKLREILDDATNKWGVKVNRVELQDINPPNDIRAAMEKQMRAERDKRAQIIEAEGLKRAQVLEAEGSKIAAITKAEGIKDADILAAEGKAQARRLKADAEAEAIRLVTEAIQSKDAGDPTNYLVAIKYVDALEKMTEGKDNKIIYMPYEISGVLSSIGGIKDLIKDK